VFVDAAGAVSASAGAEGDLSVFEVAEELLPFLLGRGPVFAGGPELATPVDEGAVAIDGFFGVDG
jgi:hypothetical protein